MKLNIYSFVCFILLSLALADFSHAGHSLIFAVHPYLPATELVRKFSPLVHYLAKEIKQPVLIWISKDYRDHIDKVGKGEADIAYMGSASYVKMVAHHGEKPLLARLEVNGKPTFRGVIIVREDSPLLAIKDLIGKRFAFGDPNSTMSHLVPRYVLWRNGVSIEQLAEYAFLRNHRNVALGVLAGVYDAGALKEEVFDRYAKRGLRTLMRTPPISEYVFVASNRLPASTVETLRSALYRLRDSEEGQGIMASIKHSVTGMVPAKDGDYDDLRVIMETLGQLGVQR